jgi:glycine/D-amino acid oxidase-like deaminating enzyme
MSENTSVDCIIVGMGLAGSAMAVQLINAGKTIAVFDQPEKNTSSRVAAGLFNPVTGNKMVKTWLADKIFPYLHEFYSRVEELTGKTFFYPMPLYRPFISVAEQNEWMGRSADDGYKDVIADVFTAPAFEGVHNPFGGLLLKQCGYVNTTGFIDSVTALVQTKNVYRETRFDPSMLIFRDDGVQYEGITASKIIFCEGHHVSENPWFNGVQIRGLKGEIIHIKSTLNKDVIINRGVYMVPSGDAFLFKIGSTYNQHDKTEGVTTEARLELEEKMKDLIQLPYQITGQEWGIRPTTADRRPILGAHPKFKNLLIFNGLGTKGVSLAPYFSKILFQWIENGSPLHKEVDVTRYKLLY